jgi:Flp pilus assembly protein TadD
MIRTEVFGSAKERNVYRHLHTIMMRRSSLPLLALLAALFLSGCVTAGKKGNGMPSDPRAEAEADGAVRDSTEIAEALPLSAEEYERQGDENARNGNAEKAFLDYAKALIVEPENAGIRYKRGMLLVKRGVTEEAVDELRTAIELDPGHAKAHAELGRLLLKEKRLREAEPVLRRAVELDEKSWQARCHLGILLNYRKAPEEALEQFREALRYQPGNAALHNNMAISLSVLGRYREAVERFRRALSLGGPEPTYYNNLAFAHFALGNYRHAFDAFREAGGEARAYNNLGVLLMRRGDRRAATSCFEKAVQAEPSYFAVAAENLKRARGEDMVEILSERNGSRDSPVSPEEPGFERSPVSEQSRGTSAVEWDRFGKSVSAKENGTEDNPSATDETVERSTAEPAALLPAGTEKNEEAGKSGSGGPEWISALQGEPRPIHPQLSVNRGVGGEADPGKEQPIYVVQLGTFTKKGNAERLIQRLKEKGYSPLMKDYELPDLGIVHAVRLEPVASLVQARTLKKRIEKEEGVKPLNIRIDPDKT